jgi:hypothetical protein
MYPNTINGRIASCVEYDWRFGASLAAVCRESEKMSTFRLRNGAKRVAGDTPGGCT